MTICLRKQGEQTLAFHNSSNTQGPLSFIDAPFIIAVFQCRLSRAQLPSFLHTIPANRPAVVDPSTPHTVAFNWNCNRNAPKYKFPPTSTLTHFLRRQRADPNFPCLPRTICIFQWNIKIASVPVHVRLDSSTIM